MQKKEEKNENLKLNNTQSYLNPQEILPNRPPPVTSCITSLFGNPVYGIRPSEKTSHRRTPVVVKIVKYGNYIFINNKRKLAFLFV